MTALSSHPVLALNADFRPLSYSPLSLWPWTEAIKALFLDRVNLVAEYDAEIRSPSRTMRIPSVIALKEYVPRPDVPAFTRRNVFLRDDFRCQYCGEKFPTDQLTFDHVLPRAQGGVTEWTNICAACGPCNLRKAAQTPEQAGMTLLQKPYQPTRWTLESRAAKLQLPNHRLHETWLDFVYWDSELES